MGVDLRPRLFLSYSGTAADDAQHFRKFFLDGLDVVLEDWIVDSGYVGELPLALAARMRECRIFVLLINSEYPKRIAADECELLANWFKNKPAWSKDRLVVPVLLSREGEKWWLGRGDTAVFPDQLTRAVHRSYFDTTNGACDFFMPAAGSGEMRENKGRSEDIRKLRDAVKVWIAKSKPASEESRDQPDPAGPPAVFLFGGMEWALDNDIAGEREKMLQLARAGGGDVGAGGLVDIGDNWGSPKARRANRKTFEDRAGHVSHVVMVADRKLAQQYGTYDDYQALALEEIRLNLGGERTGSEGQRLLWLPAGVPVPQKFPDADPDGFALVQATPDDMAARVRALLGCPVDASVLFQNPGSSYHDIADWTRHDFAKVFAIRARTDSFPNVDSLAKQVGSILASGDERIILMVGDHGIDAGGLDHWGAKKLFEERLRAFEIAMRTALETARACGRSSVIRQFARVFLQFRNPQHAFGELQVGRTRGDMTDQRGSIWWPLRFENGAPVKDCVDVLRDEIRNICQPAAG